LTRKREAELEHEKEKKRLESLDDIVPHPQPVVEKNLQENTASAGSGDRSPSKDETTDRKDAPILSKEKVEDWEKVSDIYNGGEMENYKWSQTITDIDVRVPVPEGTTAKDVKVDIRSDHMKVELRRPSPQVVRLES